MRSAGIVAILSALGLAGCVEQAQNYALKTTYSEESFAPWAKEGNATLKGQAFLKTVGGEVRTCAGENVLLEPANEYTIEFWNNVLNKGYNITNDNSSRAKFNKLTPCDSQGNFRIDGLAAQKWYVITTVSWGVPTQYGIEKQGGTLAAILTLKPGENTLIMNDVHLVK